jgi:hypothetical protein
MKNIIPWSSANETFSKKLLSRLRHILKPLLHKETEDKKISTERSGFALLPLNSKILMLKNKSVSLLKIRSFQRFKGNYYFPQNGTHLTSNAILVRKSENKM